MADDIKDFRKALAKHNHARAVSTWKKVQDSDKKALKGEPDTVVEMLKVMHADGIAPMKEVGVDFATDPRFAPTSLDTITGTEASKYLTQMDSSGLWTTFLAAPPDHGTLTAPQVKKLGHLANAVSYTHLTLPTKRIV